MFQAVEKRKLYSIRGIGQSRWFATNIITSCLAPSLDRTGNLNMFGSLKMSILTFLTAKGVGGMVLKRVRELYKRTAFSRD